MSKKSVIQEKEKREEPMTLHIKNGMVEYLKPSGDDIVFGLLPADAVESILDCTPPKKSDRFEYYPIESQGFYFAGTVDPEE